MKDNSVAKLMFDLGMLGDANRYGSLAEARIALIERRVTLNGTPVKFATSPVPVKNGQYEICLKKFRFQKHRIQVQEIRRTFQIGS